MLQSARPTCTTSSTRPQTTSEWNGRDGRADRTLTGGNVYAGCVLSHTSPILAHGCPTHPCIQPVSGESLCSSGSRQRPRAKSLANSVATSAARPMCPCQAAEPQTEWCRVIQPHRKRQQTHKSWCADTISSSHTRNWPRPPVSRNVSAALQPYALWAPPSQPEFEAARLSAASS